MGATTFAVIAKGKTIREAFDSAVAEARYEYGHGGYTGTIAEKSGYTLRRPAMQQADALRFSHEDVDLNDKWGDAFCIPIQSDSGEVDRYLFYGWASE